jgi:hypothetical protein
MNHPAWKAFIEAAPHNPHLLDFHQFSDLANRLVSHRPFQVARYNDGEWVFMFKTEPYYSRYIARSNYPLAEVEEISKKMMTVIDSRPAYFIGIDSTTLAGAGSIEPDYEAFQRKISGLNIIYGEIFNAATVMYGIEALKKPLANRWVLTVGPDYMKMLKMGEQHISVPLKSCWTAADTIEKQLEEVLTANLSKQPVVLYSCSLLAKWLIDVFYKKYGDNITQLDIGSCIDPWCGVNSRPWHGALGRYYGLVLPPMPAERITTLPASVSTGFPAPSGGYGYGYGYARRRKT